MNLNEKVEVPSWDKYFIMMCDVIKLRSKDPKRQVGACLVSTIDNRIISCGYNSLKAGVDDNIDWNDRELVHSLVLHAEMNAILYSNSRFENTILYCSLSPCRDCIKLVIAANITKIIYKDKYKDIDTVNKICQSYNITIEQFTN